jgi:hypothetical protein
MPLVPGLTIRKEQMDVLSGDYLSRNGTFSPIEHLEQCYPNEVASMGEERTLQLIADASNRCASYGIDDPGGIMRYLNLVMTFGQGFDVHGDFNWIGAILSGPASSEDKFRTIDKRLGIDEDSHVQGAG